MPAELPELARFAFRQRILLASLDAVAEVQGPVDIVHVFERELGALAAGLPALRERLAPAGMVWVSWPKRASKVPTTLTEDAIRALALASGLVDVKVCAVDATWSGLKLVIPLALRPPVMRIGMAGRGRAE